MNDLIKHRLISREETTWIDTSISKHQFNLIRVLHICAVYVNMQYVCILERSLHTSTGENAWCVSYDAEVGQNV